jgi:Tol biopolymer transport system component
VIISGRSPTSGSVAFVASPDGRRIAYRVDGGTASQDGVYVRPIDGGRPTLVTHTGAPASSGRRPATSSCCSR